MHYLHCIIIIMSLLDFVGENEVKFTSGDLVESRQLSYEVDAAVSLPASLFEMIDDRDNIGVFVALYDTPIFFPVGKKNAVSNSLTQRIVGSQVLAATVDPSINFQDLDEPVTIVLRLQIPEESVSS